MRQPTTPRAFRYLVVARDIRQPYRPIGCYQLHGAALTCLRSLQALGIYSAHIRVIPWPAS